jgi:hypothetical protein
MNLAARNTEGAIGSSIRNKIREYETLLSRLKSDLTKAEKAYRAKSDREALFAGLRVLFLCTILTFPGRNTHFF